MAAKENINFLILVTERIERTMSDPNGVHVGRVIQVIGPVIDVSFDGGYLPPVYNALRVTSDGFEVPQPIDIICEVSQHLGNRRVRAVSMQPTEGIVRGMNAIDTGSQITMPSVKPRLAAC